MHNPYDRAHPFRSDPRSSKRNGPTAWRPFSSFLPRRRLISPDSDVVQCRHLPPLDDQTELESCRADDQSTE